MAWVDPEYAGEFAVVSAWLAALLPWSVSLSSPAGGSFVVVRFPFVAFQFLFGIELGAAEVPVLPMWAAPGFPQNTGVATAYTVWLAGGVAVATAVALSVVYYARETDVEAKAPVDPARLMGGLLTLGGVSLLGAVGLLFGFYAGVTVPVGALIVPVLGVALLRTDAR